MIQLHLPAGVSETDHPSALFKAPDQAESAKSGESQSPQSNQTHHHPHPPNHPSALTALFKEPEPATTANGDESWHSLVKQTTQLTQRQIERLALQRLVFERIRLCAKRYGETPDEMLEWVRSQVMPNPEP